MISGNRKVVEYIGDGKNIKTKIKDWEKIQMERLQLRK